MVQTYRPAIVVLGGRKNKTQTADGRESGRPPKLERQTKTATTTPPLLLHRTPARQAPSLHAAAALCPSSTLLLYIPTRDIPCFYLMQQSMSRHTTYRTRNLCTTYKQSQQDSLFRIWFHVLKRGEHSKINLYCMYARRVARLRPPVCVNSCMYLQQW